MNCVRQVGCIDVITQLNVEKIGAFEVSNAETMLKQV
jgi:peroxiredoxin